MKIVAEKKHINKEISTAWIQPNNKEMKQCLKNPVTELEKLPIHDLSDGRTRTEKFTG